MLKALVVKVAGASGILTVNVPDNVEVSVEFHQESNLIQIDGNYFRRVIINLLTNAVQAMPEGGKLSVKGEKIDGKSSITITDTGTGISEENMSKLFTPLFTTKAKGTGLGLAVCKRIVDAHNGVISVESVEGEGTSFKVLIPEVAESTELSLEVPAGEEMVEPARETVNA